MNTRQSTPSTSAKRKSISGTEPKRRASTAKKQKTTDEPADEEVPEVVPTTSTRSTRRSSGANLEGSLDDQPKAPKSTTKSPARVPFDIHHGSELDENPNLAWRHDGNRIEKRSPVQIVAATAIASGKRNRSRASTSRTPSTPVVTTSLANSEISTPQFSSVITDHDEQPTANVALESAEASSSGVVTTFPNQIENSQVQSQVLQHLQTLANDGSEVLGAICEACGDCVDSLDTKGRWLYFGAVGVAGLFSGIYLSLSWQSRAQLQLGNELLTVLEHMDSHTNVLAERVGHLLHS